jgi:hypothetical protein
MTTIISDSNHANSKISSAVEHRKLNRASSLSISVAALASSFDAAAAAAAAAEATSSSSFCKNTTSSHGRIKRSSTLPCPPKSAPLMSTSFENHLAILETTNKETELTSNDPTTSDGNYMMMPPTPVSDHPCNPLSTRTSPALSRTPSSSTPLTNMAIKSSMTLSSSTSSDNSRDMTVRPDAALATLLPSDVEYLTSIPVSQWGYADVADFFRATLSLPLDLSRETANFIEEQKLDGAQLTKMSELDLRRSGVNTQWCHRIVTTLGLVKERQHRRRLQLQEDNDITIAAYIEEQFTIQMELLRRIVDSQEKTEQALSEHQHRVFTMAKRIARLEYALGHRKLPVDDNDDDDEDDVISTVKVKDKNDKKSLSFMNRCVNTVKQQWFTGNTDATTTTTTTRRSSGSEPTSYISMAQGFAVGITATLFIIRLLR